MPTVLNHFRLEPFLSFPFHTAGSSETVSPPGSFRVPRVESIGLLYSDPDKVREPWNTTKEGFQARSGSGVGLWSGGLEVPLKT